MAGYTQAYAQTTLDGNHPTTRQRRSHRVLGERLVGVRGVHPHADRRDRLRGGDRGTALGEGEQRRADLCGGDIRRAP